MTVNFFGHRKMSREQPGLFGSSTRRYAPGPQGSSTRKFAQEMSRKTLDRALAISGGLSVEPKLNKEIIKEAVDYFGKLYLARGTS